MPWTYRCVVFDLDGLLVDTERIFEEAARRLLARRGRELRRDVLRAMIGTPSHQSLPLFRDGHQLSDTIEELAAECRTLFFEVLGREPAPLLPGAVELLDRLEARAVPCAIATSSSAAYVAKVLGPHGLLPRFAFVLTSDDVRQGKPAPEIYEKAAARFGEAPAALVVLEDSLNGLRSAKAAGARCVVVPHELIDVNEMGAADAIVSSLAAPELAELLGL